MSVALKRTLEEAYGQVRVRGELGKVTVHASGHVYLDIKDEKSTLSSVIWRGNVSRLRFKPEMGLEVIASGKITTFAGQSRYQLVIDSMEPAGEGALLAQLEERKRRLAGEGLFDDARKQLLPFLPEVIGVVTSPTGAVIRDILHRLADRFPRHVLLWPVRVQGETCAEEVARAIEGFNALPSGGASGITRPDVLIVARGGGSIEDLWGFNDERVVRAAAASDIPLISAIGHETDWSLLDLAADRRAPTPTGAAEMVVPVRSELLMRLNDDARRLQAAQLRLLERRRADLRSASRALPDPMDLLAGVRQRLDLATTRLHGGLSRGAQRHRTRLEDLSRRLLRQAPIARVQATRARLDGLMQRLSAARAAQLRAERKLIADHRQRLNDRLSRMRQAIGLLLSRKQDRVAHQTQLLKSLSYQAVLARGYVLVLDEGGHPLHSAGQVQEGAGYRLRFGDGEARVTGGKAS